MPGFIVFFMGIGGLLSEKAEARGGGAFFLREDLNFNYTRLEKLTDGNSFSLLSESGVMFHLHTGVFISRKWYVYLRGLYGTHAFVGPSNRTIADTNGTTYLAGLGLGWEGKDLGWYFQAESRQFVTAGETGSNQNQVLVNFVNSGAIGFLLKARSRLGYEMILDISTSLPVAAPEVNGTEVEWGYSATAGLTLEMGSRPLLWGVNANMTVDEYTLGADDYSSNKVYGGFFIKFHISN